MTFSDFVTIIAVIVSLYTANRSLQQSNRIDLLNKRLETFQLSEQLYETIVSNYQIIEFENGNQDNNPIKFWAMTNCSELESLRSVFPKPLDINDNPLNHLEDQNDFLKKMSDLKNRANLSEFLFNGIESETLSTFIKTYTDLLDGRRHYAIFMSGYREQERHYNQEHQLPKGKEIDHYEFLKNHTDELKKRKKLIEIPIKELEKSFVQYKNNREAIKDQIKLIKKQPTS